MPIIFHVTPIPFRHPPSFKIQQLAAWDSRANCFTAAEWPPHEKSPFIFEDLQSWLSQHGQWCGFRLSFSTAIVCCVMGFELRSYGRSGATSLCSEVKLPRQRGAVDGSMHKCHKSYIADIETLWMCLIEMVILPAVLLQMSRLQSGVALANPAESKLSH